VFQVSKFLNFVFWIFNLENFQDWDDDFWILLYGFEV
jgi:hypothetical protein